MPAPRLALLLLSMSLTLSGVIGAAAPRYYDVAYRAHFRPEAGVVDMEIAVSGERLPSRIVLHVDSRRHKKFTSTDPLQIEPSHVTWQPRGHASRLRYQFVVDHERAPQHYDSRMTADWAIFRAEKMVPRASVTAAQEPAIACDAGVRAAAGLGRRDAVRIGRRSALQVDDPDAPFRSAGRLDARRQDRQPQREDRQACRRRRRRAGWRQRATPGHAGVPQVHAAAPGGGLSAVAATSADRLGRRPDVARRTVGARFDVPALRPTADQREPHQHAAARAGARRAWAFAATKKATGSSKGLPSIYSLETLRRSGGISEQRYKQALKRLASGRNARRRCSARTRTGPPPHARCWRCVLPTPRFAAPPTARRASMTSRATRQ